MPTFQDISRRLIMRYNGLSTFSFGNIDRNADDEGVHGLAMAIASIQSAQPTRVSVSVVRQLI